MVAAQDLRIGNYVEDEYGNIGIVKSIDGERILSFKGRDFIGTASVYFKHYNGTMGKWLGYLNPVELTENIIIKSGGEIKPLSLGVIFDRFRFIWKQQYKYWYVVDAMSHSYMTKIEFVHEFQNFILVMNGKEIEIEL